MARDAAAKAKAAQEQLDLPLNADPVDAKDAAPKPAPRKARRARTAQPESLLPDIAQDQAIDTHEPADGKPARTGKTRAAARTSRQEVDDSIAIAMAKGQRDISVAEFFAKNRHQIGRASCRERV